jgi:hypothetical protein
LLRGGSDMTGLVWCSVIALLATACYQLADDARSETVVGTRSPLLYLGQAGAALGFVIYSLATHEGVFLIASATWAVTALARTAIYARNLARIRWAPSQRPVALSRPATEQRARGRRMRA